MQGIDWCLSRDTRFRYQLLSRMQGDCEYYLGNGDRYANHLWAGNEVEQIAAMKALWNSFSEKDKPEWLTWEQIEQYEAEMDVDEEIDR